MPMRASSHAIRIKYVPISKDGKTTVWDAVKSKWLTTDAPTPQQMTATEAKFADMSGKVQAANDTAISAKSTADTAKQVADSKVTGVQALEAARSGIFDIQYLDVHGGLPFRSIEFEEMAQGQFRVWINFGDGTSQTSATRGWLAYAPADTVNDILYQLIDIEKRLAAIEKKLGISS